MKRLGRWSLVGVALAGVVLAFSVRTWRGHAAVSADPGRLGAGKRRLPWDHPAAIRDGHCHGAGSRSIPVAPPAGTPIQGARSSSSSRDRSPFTKRSAASARSRRTARGRHSSSAPAKSIRSPMTARPPTFFSSPSRVCRRAAPRELTSRIPARARVSDELTRWH